MPRKSSRRIYDPALAADSNLHALGDSYEEQDHGNLGVGYRDDPLDNDPLAPHDDNAYHDEERQVTEIVDPKLHDLPLPRRIQRKRRRRWILAATIGLAVILGVGIGVHRRNERNHSASESSSSSSSSSVVYLPFVPSNLAQVCNLDAIKADATALQECRQLCQPAECCDFPSNLDLSCLQGNEDACFQYHTYCAVLHENIGLTESVSRTIPPAPTNLAQLCSLEALSRNDAVQACASACEPVQCCYETELPEGQVSCRLETNCAGYSACMNLRAQDNLSLGIAQEIDRKCGPSGIMTQCLEACAVARCCFFGDWQCDYKTENELFCTQYSACSSIPGWGPEDMTDDSPTFSPTLEFTYEPTFSPTIAGTDFTFEPTSTFAPTPEGFGGISNVPPPLPANLAQTCRALGQGNDDDNRFECSELCSMAECCSFPAKFPQSCLDTHTQLCLQYSLACAPLDTNKTHVTVELDIKEGTLEDASLAEVCSIESISYVRGLRECKSRCAPAKCCWKPAGERCDDPRCHVYAPCLNLVAMKRADQDIIETVQTACRTSMLKTPEGRAVCESVCLQHSCCFRDDCFVDDATACDNYDGCAILHESGNKFTAPQAGHVTLPAPVNLQDLCDPVFLDDPLFYNECAEACSAAECCNYPANMEFSCLRGNEDVCFTYHRLCASLRTRGTTSANTAKVNPAPNNLPELCEPTSLATEYGLKQCQNHCYSASCCWLDNIPGQQSCVDNNLCSGYAACLNLRASLTESSTISEEVSTTCTINQVLTAEGKAQCDQVCRQHQCCWEPGANSCFREAICRQYDGCELLIDLDNNGIPDATQVDNPLTWPPVAAPPTDATAATPTITPSTAARL